MITLAPGAQLVAPDGAVGLASHDVDDPLALTIIEPGATLTLLRVVSVEVRTESGETVEVRLDAVRMA